MHVGVDTKMAAFRCAGKCSDENSGSLRRTEMERNSTDGLAWVGDGKPTMSCPESGNMVVRPRKSACIGRTP